MRKTRFAGLTVVAPDETLAVDNSSFQSSNPDIIDHFLEVGAVTHRHDAHDRLPDPLTAPTGVVDATGGTIGSDVTMFVGYTLVDPDGGETRLSPAVTLTTDPPYEPPTSPIDATVSYASGALRADTYYYAITLMDGSGGETPVGPIVSVDRQPGPDFASITIDGLTRDLADFDAVGWRLYRATAGQQLGYLASGFVDRFVDAGQGCVDCGQAPPSDNRTNRTNRLRVIAPGSATAAGSGVPALGAASFRVYASLDGGFASDCLLGEYPAASAGAELFFTSLALRPGRPPDVATTTRGARQLDAETDLTDYWWRSPVTGSANLPPLPDDGRRGFVRLDATTGRAYGNLGSGGAWVPLGSANVQRIGLFGSAAVDAQELQIRGSGGVVPVSVQRSASPAGASAVVTIDVRPPVTEPMSSGLAAFTFDAGAGQVAPLPASGGASFTSLAEKRLSLEQSVYIDGDGTVRVHMTATTNGTVGVMLRKRGSDGLVGRWNGTGLEVGKLEGGVFTRYDVTPIAGLPADRDYWIRARVFGNRVLAQMYSSPPGFEAQGAIAVCTAVVPLADRDRYGAGVRGSLGLQVIPGALSWVVGDLRLRPEARRHSRYADPAGQEVLDPAGILVGSGLALASAAGGSAVISLGPQPVSVQRVEVFGGAGVDQVRTLRLRGVGAAVSITDLGGGSAQVDINASGGAGGGGALAARAWASGALNLASGASGVSGLDLGLAYRLYRIGADRPTRVQLYASSAHQLADRGRAMGVDPTGDHGVMLDFFLPANDLSWTMTPLVDGANLDPNPSQAIPVTITNLGAPGVTTISLLYARTE